VAEFRAGVRDTSVTHAVVRRRLRRHALCGAGPIKLILLDAFDPSSYSSCLDCARLVDTQGNRDATSN
jgi:hypothetical protein